MLYCFVLKVRAAVSTPMNALKLSQKNQHFNQELIQTWGNALNLWENHKIKCIHHTQDSPAKAEEKFLSLDKENNQRKHVGHQEKRNNEKHRTPRKGMFPSSDTLRLGPQ